MQAHRHDIELRGAMGVSTRFCTIVRYASWKLSSGAAGRPSVRLDPHRLATSTPISLEWKEAAMPSSGSPSEHR